MSKFKKIQITYSDFGKMMEQMVLKLQNKHYSAIHGLPRGGLSIAVHLSHFLELPLITNISMYTPMNLKEENDKLLVVDDIIDSGRTFERFSEIATIRKIKYETAVLYYKPFSEHIPDVYIRETEDWIVFPWEPYEESVNRANYEILNDEDSADTLSYDMESDYTELFKNTDEEENDLESLLNN